MIEIVLRQFTLQVADLADNSGEKIMIFTTQSGIVITVPLTEEGKRGLVTALTGLDVAAPNSNLMREIKRIR